MSSIERIEHDRARAVCAALLDSIEAALPPEEALVIRRRRRALLRAIAPRCRPLMRSAIALEALCAAVAEAHDPESYIEAIDSYTISREAWEAIVARTKAC